MRVAQERARLPERAQVVKPLPYFILAWLTFQKKHIGADDVCMFSMLIVIGLWMLWREKP